MLVQVPEIRDILVCPRCHGPLREVAAGLQCSQPSCGLSDHAFPMVAAQPAMIDFDESILDRAELLANAGSACADLSHEGRTRGALTRAVLRMIFGYNRVAEAKVSEFLAELHDFDAPGSTAGDWRRRRR